MRTRGIILELVVALSFALPSAGSDVKDQQPEVISLRLTVVLSEFDGSKKLTNLPYSMPCGSSTNKPRATKVKIGFRVPFTALGQIPVQYQDVGTNLECSAEPGDEHGEFIVHLKAEHATVYAAGQNSPVEWHPGAPLAEHPVIGQVVGEFAGIVVHDGQVFEAMVGADSTTGHVWKMEVTLTAVK